MIMYMKDSKKRDIDKCVRRMVKEYGETMRLLGKDD